MDETAFTRREVNAALLGAALAAAMGRPAPRQLFDFAIAGGHHHGLAAAMPSLRPGLLLGLRREADNPVDPDAVAVHGPDGRRLGYLPREANTPVARLLDGGATLQATVAGFMSATRWEDVPDDLVFTHVATGDPILRLTHGRA